MATPNKNSAGKMQAQYGRERAHKYHLQFRYRTRARLTVDNYRECSDRPPTPRVLDMGCADGRTLLEIRQLLGGRGCYDGVELSDELLSIAATPPPEVTFHKGDVTGLPATLEETSYSLVTALAVLEHLSKPQQCVAEAYRMLRPGGIFVATCPSPTWDHIASRLRLMDDEHHEQDLTLDDMIILVKEVGFEIISAHRFMCAPVGLLTYLGVPVSPALGLKIDKIVSRLPMSALTFVNQAVCGCKPI